MPTAPNLYKRENGLLFTTRCNCGIEVSLHIVKHLIHLQKYFWRNKYRLGFGILFTLMSNYFGVLSPQVTQYIINKVTAYLDNKSFNENWNSYDPAVRSVIQYLHANISFANVVVYCGMVLILLALLRGLFTFLMRQTIIVMSRHIEYDQKNDIYNHYQGLDALFYKRNKTGDLMNRISEDVSKVRMFTGPAIMYTTNLVALIGMSVYYMLKTNVMLTICTLFPLPILAYVIYKVNTVISKKSEIQQQKLSMLTTNAQESYSGIRVIKAFVQEHAFGKVFEKNSDAYKTAALSLAKTEAWYFPSIALLIGLSTLVTIMVGGLLKASGDASIGAGTIAAFVLYISMLSFPFSSIGWVASIIQKAAASQKRINEFLLQEPEIKNTGTATLSDGIATIAMHNVSYTYADTGIEALKSIDLTIQKGQKIAVVGRTGSGKSTLVQMLLRMYNVSAGEILINNEPIDYYALEHYRAQISYVPQDVFLFSDTIAANIAFGHKQATPDDVRNAASNAKILTEILQFQNGMDTVVGERGVTLSGGQKQRISIARALLKKAELYIFDDCLSAVDVSTEAAITKNLQQFLRDKTSIFVTHRLLNLMQFDCIYVLDQGKIVEYGTHEALLANSGLYFDMYQEQLQNN
jgi:ATP-binding cassette subfamily B protein